MARRCLSETPSDDVACQSLGRLVLAIIAARRGDPTAAELAAEAARLVDATEFPLLRALTHLDVAIVLREIGMDKDARTHAAEALRMAIAKEATALENEARALLDGVRGG